MTTRPTRRVVPVRHAARLIAALASSILLGSMAIGAAPDGGQTPAAPAAPAPHVTAPPPGSPVPGSRCLGCGVAPEPMDYADRAGWTQIFDGKTLTNWDGNPEVWKVEDGAIVAENWPERRVGSTFVIWRGGEPSDFELKLEVKADYDIHSGIFYRSVNGPTPARAGGAGGAATGRAGAAGGGAGAPAGRAAAPATGAAGAPAAAGAGRAAQPPPAVPADPRWNVYGYAVDWDWDPGNNGNLQDLGGRRTDTQIAWRGHIVRTEAGKRPRSIGTVGDRDLLMKDIKLGEWNQVHIIAQGHQLTHIVNGRVMAILIDDDPAAFKAKGVIALQIEQFGSGKIAFRDIWLKQ